MTYTPKEWTDGDNITSDELNNMENGILYNSQNHQEYLSIRGGFEPIMSVPSKEYEIQITLPPKNLDLYGNNGQLVKTSDDSYISQNVLLPNNNALIWNLTSNTIYPVSFGTKVDDEYVILATNAYGRVADGYFKQFYLKNMINNGNVVIASPGFPDKAINDAATFSVSITLPTTAIFYLNQYNELVSTLDNSYWGQSFIVPNNNGLYWDVTDNKILVLASNQVNNHNLQLLAYNSYTTISSGLFENYFKTQSKLDDYLVFMGGVGFKPTFSVDAKHIATITLPISNTLYIRKYDGNDAIQIKMTGQSFVLNPLEYLVYNVTTKKLEIQQDKYVRTNKVMLAFNNWGQITNGYFSRFWFEYVAQKQIDALSTGGQNQPNDYYKDYMNTKMSQIQQAELNYSRGDQFIFITDVHWKDNSKQSPLLIEQIKKNTGVSKVMFGGDIPIAYGSKETMDNEILDFNKSIREYKRERDYYPIIGNHDFTIRTSATSTDGFTYSASESYGLIGRDLEDYTNIKSGKIYYYKDNTAQKIRYVFVNTEESVDDTTFWGVNAKISQEQANWLVNDALQAPDGYQIVVFGHVPIEESMPNYNYKLDILRKILEAVNNKSIINMDSGYGAVVNHDFSNSKVKVIAYIAGHCHKDRSINSNGLLHITTGCDAHYNDDTFTRTGGTTSEQLFDVFFIDSDNSKINTIRIGAGDDRSFNY
ncbi:metallophosphoesterase family protein [Leuconostoc mesenteroides]|uniref:metallophosphoesterase family protein n=1 Tax=Leuconostoc mesenteroides TaxID=1245 RepID=UPI003B50D23A